MPCAHEDAVRRRDDPALLRRLERRQPVLWAQAGYQMAAGASLPP